MNIRDDIYQLLTTLPTPVHHTKIDPLKSNEYPCINVRYMRTKQDIISHDSSWYRQYSDILVTVADSLVDTNYDSNLDSLVENIKQTLMTSGWTNNFESVSGIDTVYDYIRAGENDLAVASITFSTVHSDEYITEFNIPLETVSIDMDLGVQTREVKSLDSDDWSSDIPNPLDIDNEYSHWIEVNKSNQIKTLVDTTDGDGLIDSNITIQLPQ